MSSENNFLSYYNSNLRQDFANLELRRKKVRRIKLFVIIIFLIINIITYTILGFKEGITTSIQILIILISGLITYYLVCFVKWDKTLTRDFKSLIISKLILNIAPQAKYKQNGYISLENFRNAKYSDEITHHYKGNDFISVTYNDYSMNFSIVQAIKRERRNYRGGTRVHQFIVFEGIFGMINLSGKLAANNGCKISLLENDEYIAIMNRIRNKLHRKVKIKFENRIMYIFIKFPLNLFDIKMNKSFTDFNTIKSCYTILHSIIFDFKEIVDTCTFICTEQ